MRDLLTSLSAFRAKDGFSPSGAATLIFLLKEPLFIRLRGEIPDPEALADEIWSTTLLLDKLGVFTTRDVSKNS